MEPHPHKPPKSDHKSTRRPLHGGGVAIVNRPGAPEYTPGPHDAPTNVDDDFWNLTPPEVRVNPREGGGGVGKQTPEELRDRQQRDTSIQCTCKKGGCDCDCVKRTCEDTRCSCKTKLPLSDLYTETHSQVHPEDTYPAAGGWYRNCKCKKTKLITEKTGEIIYGQPVIKEYPKYTHDPECELQKFREKGLLTDRIKMWTVAQPVQKVKLPRIKSRRSLFDATDDADTSVSVPPPIGEDSEESWPEWIKRHAAEIKNRAVGWFIGHRQGGVYFIF